MTPMKMRWRKICWLQGMEEILERIRDFADKAHGDQMRKYSPERYIVHPVRVMEICRQYNSDVTVLAAALLHDVLEDTKVSRKEMKNFLLTIFDSEKAEKVLNVVKELTDQYTKLKHPLLNRYRRKAKEHQRLGNVSPEAQTVKYADLIDNSVEIASQDPDFAPRYLDEAKDLLNRMKRGNERLRERAIQTVRGLEK